jgi:hypothetical protein
MLDSCLADPPRQPAHVAPAAEQEHRADAFQRGSEGLWELEVALHDFDFTGQARARAIAHHGADRGSSRRQRGNDFSADVAGRTRNEDHVTPP